MNLRTYVVHRGEPGVYFFSLDAQGVLGVVGARLFHHLPYYYARIDLVATGGGSPAADSPAADEPRPAGEVRVSSRRRHPGAPSAALVARYGPIGEPVAVEPGSLERFLVERYRYYATGPLGGLRYADVDHEPWPLYRADPSIESETLFSANRFERPDADPVCHYSPGVDTVASGSRRA